jgi:hypothetical protein
MIWGHVELDLSSQNSPKGFCDLGQVSGGGYCGHTSCQRYLTYKWLSNFFLLSLSLSLQNIRLLLFWWRSIQSCICRGFGFIMEIFYTLSVFFAILLWRNCQLNLQYEIFMSHLLYVLEWSWSWPKKFMVMTITLTFLPKVWYGINAYYQNRLMQICGGERASRPQSVVANRAPAHTLRNSMSVCC